MMTSFFDPVTEINALRREIDRAFDTFRGNPFRNAFLPARGPRQYPFVNIAEDNDNVYLEALAPGLDPESLQITVLRNQLTIAGDKPATAAQVKSEDVHRSERAAGRFVRTFTLPAEVDDTKVQAAYRNGILYITLPKAEVAKPKRITVNVA